MLYDFYKIEAVMYSLLREDIIFLDSIAHRWSVRKQEGFYRFSELFRKHYGTTDFYGTLSNGSIYARQARTVNYSELVRVLKSKDAALLEENKWIWDGNFRFLDKKEKIGPGGHLNHIQFTSFPRSGNSFLRRLVEQLTGITTGSTMTLVTATSL